MINSSSASTVVSVSAEFAQQETQHSMASFASVDETLSGCSTASTGTNTSTCSRDSGPPRRKDSIRSAASRRSAATVAVAGEMRQVVQGQLFPELLGPDVQVRLERNAGTLVDLGIDTPAALRALMDECWRHDATLAAAGLGLTSNVGYFAGITLANEKLVALMPKSLLANAPLLGGVVGLGLGFLDVACAVAGSAVIGPKLYNGPNAELPWSLPRPSSLRTWMASVARATGLNVAKNLTRMAAPPLQALVERHLGHQPLGSIDRTWSSRIDATVLDGGLGFVSAGLNQMLKLGAEVPYDTRLLLREDLGAVIGKARHGNDDPPSAAAGRALRAFASPAVPLAAVATIGAFVSALFAAHAAIDEAMGSDALPPDRLDVGVTQAKRAASVVTIGLMTAAIEFGAPLVQRGGEALWSSVADAQWPDIGSWARQARSLLPI
jgi:hypothetical protein